MRGGFNWVFSSFLSDTLFRGSWRSEPWAFDELLILLENLLTYGISCYHIYIPCFGNILKKEFLCLNHLCITIKLIYKLIIETTNLFWKPNSSMSYFRT
jgi:hypothetical protein